MHRDTHLVLNGGADASCKSSPAARSGRRCGSGLSIIFAMQNPRRADVTSRSFFLGIEDAQVGELAEDLNFRAPAVASRSYADVATGIAEADSAIVDALKTGRRSKVAGAIVGAIAVDVIDDRGDVIQIDAVGHRVDDSVQKVVFPSHRENDPVFIFAEISSNVSGVRGVDHAHGPIGREVRNRTYAPDQDSLDFVQLETFPEVIDLHFDFPELTYPDDGEFAALASSAAASPGPSFQSLGDAAFLVLTGIAASRLRSRAVEMGLPRSAAGDALQKLP